MERGRIITWYLYSEDVHTQAAIVGQLDPDNDFTLGKVCEDGEPRNLWKTDYALVTYLKKSVRKGEVFDFLVFRQEGGGPIKFWDGFPKEKYQKEAQAFAAKARAIKQRIQAA